MKKYAIFFAVLVVAFYGRDIYLRRSAEKSSQWEPEGAVEDFMAGMSRLTMTIWQESQRDELASEVEEMEAKGEETTREEVEDLFERYGLVSRGHLFRNERTARGITSAFMLMRFEEFEVLGSDLDGDEATVNVSVMPLDFLGMQALVGQLSPDAPESRMERQHVRFRMERRRYRWYITGIDGELSRLARAFGRM